MVIGVFVVAAIGYLCLKAKEKIEDAKEDLTEKAS